MSEKPSFYAAKRIRKGIAINDPAIIDTLQELVLALENLEVRSEKRSRIDWANGYPVIIIDETDDE